MIAHYLNVLKSMCEQFVHFTDYSPRSKVSKPIVFYIDRDFFWILEEGVV